MEIKTSLSDRRMIVWIPFPDQIQTRPFGFDKYDLCVRIADATECFETFAMVFVIRRERNHAY